MKTFKADLHIHTVLSPCASLEMSPERIIAEARKKKLEILGITDHNSTKHCNLIEKIAARNGIMVLKGTEITTREEIHCLAFFENTETLTNFQQYLDTTINKVKNDTNLFGHQIVVDENEKIVEEIEWLLISSIDQSIEQVEQKIHEMDGIFIPAHIMKPHNSLISQLGFVPPTLKADAFERGPNVQLTDILPLLSHHPGIPVVNSSDAHIPEDIGKRHTTFLLEKPTFSEIKLAFSGKQGRKILAE